MVAERKYISEFGLNMVCDFICLCQQDELRSLDESGFKPHIYLICRRPRISLVPESVIFETDVVRGVFRKQIKDTYIELPFTRPNEIGTKDLVLRCEYPYSHYLITRPDGTFVTEGKAAMLMAIMCEEHAHHVDLEVLYVGQSYGTSGGRNATQRLEKHETLQGIYAEAMKRSPDQDIWLVLPTFKEVMIGTFDGSTEGGASISLDADSEHLDDVFDNPISEQQKVNFTEAALIRYFSPEYNTKFKDTFPNPAHDSYAECYDVDLNAVSFELESLAVYARLWSPAVKPSYEHHHVFHLHSKEERRSMFNFFGRDAV